MGKRDGQLEDVKFCDILGNFIGDLEPDDPYEDDSDNYTGVDIVESDDDSRGLENAQDIQQDEYSVGDQIENIKPVDPPCG